MKTIIITMFCLIAVIGCKNSATVTENNDTLLKEAQKVAHQFIDALAKCDSSEIFNTLSLSPELTVIMDTVFYDQNNFRTIARQMIPNFSYQTFENMTENYTLINPNVFVFNYKCLNKMYEKSGLISIIDPVCSSYTFRREQGGWKIIHMHESYKNMRIDSSMVKR